MYNLSEIFEFKLFMPLHPNLACLHLEKAHSLNDNSWDEVEGSSFAYAKDQEGVSAFTFLYLILFGWDTNCRVSSIITITNTSTLVCNQRASKYYYILRSE